MYYTEPTIAADGGMRDRREGKSGMSRRSYMESKELHKGILGTQYKMCAECREKKAKVEAKRLARETPEQAFTPSLPAGKTSTLTVQSSE